MTLEPRDGGADVEAIYAAGLSGYYPNAYLTKADLQALSDHCLRGKRVICNIEAFEIDGEFDIARPDLSLYGEDPSQKAKSWSDRASDSASFVALLLDEVAKEQNRVMFQVWLDWDGE
ncbi:hypothetical protein [Caulobacter soli]|uniref:hypothetical protein n=1 Tax=Caulobacter soli TaxID=2708539 RepID=UPI0013EBB89E|nr:hypothetical protein [Caulobacter soli]